MTPTCFLVAEGAFCGGASDFSDVSPRSPRIEYKDGITISTSTVEAINPKTILTATSIAKDFIVLQKQSFESAFGVVELFHAQVEKAGTLLLDQMGMGESAHKFLHPWQTMFKRGCDESKKFIDDNISCMEDYLKLLSNKGVTE